MKKSRLFRDHKLGLIFLGTALLATAGAAQEDEAPQLGWFDVAEFSVLASGGNSEVQTVSLRNTATRRWDSSTLEIAAGGVRAESTTRSRFAVGTPSEFTVGERSETSLTAENYFLRGRYDHEISERFFWFAGLGWNKNEFAGIDRRLAASAGVGHRWFDTDAARLRTDYGATFTDQMDVSGSSSSFAGLRLSYDYWRRLNDSTAYASALEVDENLDDTGDYRADFLNSVSVAMSDRLALKASLQLLYDNRPALTEVLLLQDDIVDGTTVLVELDNLDSVVTVSLVANF